MHKRRLKKDAL